MDGPMTVMTVGYFLKHYAKKGILFRAYKSKVVLCVERVEKKEGYLVASIFGDRKSSYRRYFYAGDVVEMVELEKFYVGLSIQQGW